MVDGVAMSPHLGYSIHTIRVQTAHTQLECNTTMQTVNLFIQYTHCSCIIPLFLLPQPVPLHLWAVEHRVRAEQSTNRAFVRPKDNCDPIACQDDGLVEKTKL